MGARERRKCQQDAQQCARRRPVGEKGNKYDCAIESGKDTYWCWDNNRPRVRSPIPPVVVIVVLGCTSPAPSRLSVQHSRTMPAISSPLCSYYNIVKALLSQCVYRRRTPFPLTSFRYCSKCVNRSDSAWQEGAGGAYQSVFVKGR